MDVSIDECGGTKEGMESLPTGKTLLESWKRRPLCIDTYMKWGATHGTIDRCSVDVVDFG